MSFTLPSSFPFAGIVDYETDVPCNVELEEWKAAPLSIVFFSKLYLTQDSLFFRQLFNEVKLNPDHDDYIHVGVWKNKYYLYNGHHRAAKAALQGEVGMMARLVYFD